MAIRLNRFLAEAGLGSRRGVEALIRSGRVRVNGQPVRELATSVDPERDQVQVDGNVVRPRVSSRLLMYNKPVGIVCSFRRQGASACLADVFAQQLRSGRLFHIGRLDKDSTGLLLLGDDGELAHAITHPRQALWKRYRVRVETALTQEELEQIRVGELLLDGKKCLPAKIGPGRSLPRGVEYELHLREGRNRQIRRLFEHFGSRVHSLHRSGFGPLGLSGLQSGAWRDLRPEEIRALREAAGLTSA